MAKERKVKEKRTSMTLAKAAMFGDLVKVLSHQSSPGESPSETLNRLVAERYMRFTNFKAKYGQENATATELANILEAQNGERSNRHEGLVDTLKRIIAERDMLHSLQRGDGPRARSITAHPYTGGPVSEAAPPACAVKH